MIELKLILVCLFLNFTNNYILHAKPTTYKQVINEWSEIILSKQAFDDKGMPLGEPEVEIFVNPKKCHFSIEHLNQLICQQSESYQLKLKEQHGHQRPKFKVKPLVEVNGDFQTFTLKTNKNSKFFEYEGHHTAKNPYKNIIVTQNSVIKPPRLDCPIGQKLDYFGNCKDIW